MDKLTGKTAVITGGGTGIGRAIAKRFHEEGASALICGRRPQKLEEAAKFISPEGKRIHTVAADVTREDDIRRLIDEAVKVTGRLDILVNNAGFMRFAALEDVAPDEWDAMIAVNVTAPWRLMVHVLPHMRKAGGGSIINISSIAGLKAFPGSGAYCTSKAALQMVSQVMAMEAAKDNIRVNLIAPAVIEGTEIADPVYGPENVAHDFYDRLRPLHPLGRNGRSEDVAEAALFFASQSSSWVSGVILNVDGGRHLATNRPPEG